MCHNTTASKCAKFQINKLLLPNFPGNRVKLQLSQVATKNQDKENKKIKLQDKETNLKSGMKDKTYGINLNKESFSQLKMKK